MNDQSVRQQALACDSSFIVQAPAGSGKTELLTQRFLKLLIHTPNAPEEVLAITFTRKAASEMRQRVVESLQRAMHAPQPDQEPAATNWAIARQVLERDQRSKWQLTESPNRLRIMTIDSFCSALVRQMPLLSELGAVPAIVEDPLHLYQMAAEQALAPIQQRTQEQASQSEASQDAVDPYVRYLKQVLSHLDNQLDKLQGLVSNMLSRRDQWLGHIAPYYRQGEALRAQLQEALQVIVEQMLNNQVEELEAWMAQADLGLELSDLESLIRFAADHLRQMLPSNAFEQHPFGKYVNKYVNTYVNEAQATSSTSLSSISGLPTCSRQTVLFWQAVAHLLTTQSSGSTQWRKGRGITKKLGFVNPNQLKKPEEKKVAKEAKSRLVALLETLAASPGADKALLCFEAIHRLPADPYNPAQWGVIEALINILIRAVGELKLVFQLEGHVDFSEISMAALRALGDEEMPTDLALKLDYQIQHILVDEFQDTSIAQFDLLRGLTRGWMPNDGRTLFLVGDPMQSIYRFREADVSLFLKARDEGVGSVSLSFLQLTNNFRSYPAIIEWVNAVFQQVLPEEDNLVTGAVSYSPSVAARASITSLSSDKSSTSSDLSESSESLELIEEIVVDIDCQDDGQIERLLDRVQQIRRHNPDERIAVLIRARTHALAMIRRFRQASIPYQAVEIDALAHKPLIIDLLSLTKALYYWSDRIAWIAVLRAPWCGLSLDDLHHLLQSGSEEHRTALVWEACLKATAEQLSSEGWLRLSHFNAVVGPLLSERYRCSPRACVEKAWIALGGVNYTSTEDLPDAERFFQLLESVEQGWDITDIEQLERQVERLFASPDVTAENPVQIMTIHKSKGLEFDTVFIPHLQKSGRYDDAALLSWLRQEHPERDQDLLLFAPIKESYGQEDRIYDFIRQLERQKALHELGRLFYVAVTRAKRALYLSATLTLKALEEQGEESDEDDHLGAEALREAVQKAVARVKKESLLSMLLGSVLTEEEVETSIGLSSSLQGSKLQEDKPKQSSGDAEREHADAWVLPVEWLDQREQAEKAEKAEKAWKTDTESNVATEPRDTASNGKAESNDKSLVDVQAENADEAWQAKAGIVLHQLLEGVSAEFMTLPESAFTAKRDLLTALSSNLLIQQGLQGEVFHQANELIIAALSAIRTDPKAGWIFRRRPFSENEWSVSLSTGEKVERYRVDRLFIDEQDGEVTLWIIDYKLSQFDEDEAKSVFYERQYQRYASQLNHYGKVASQLLQNSYPHSQVRLGLYFPLIQGWYEWGYEYGE